MSIFGIDIIGFLQENWGWILPLLLALLKVAMNLWPSKKYKKLFTLLDEFIDKALGDIRKPQRYRKDKSGKFVKDDNGPFERNQKGHIVRRAKKGK